MVSFLAHLSLVDAPRPVPQLTETLVLPVERWTLFGLRRGPVVNHAVRLCFHSDEGFWLECPDGVDPSAVEKQLAPALAEARARMLKDQSRRSTITATYRRQKSEIMSPADLLPPPSVTEVASEATAAAPSKPIIRYDRETTTEKLRNLRALRAQQSAGGDGITQREVRVALGTPLPALNPEAAVDVFSAIDAAEAAAAAPRSGTSPFRHDKTAITARIQWLRERQRTPLPSSPGVGLPRDEVDEAIAASQEPPPARLPHDDWDNQGEHGRPQLRPPS